MLKLLAISLLAAFVLLASIQPQATRAATAVPAVNQTCGANIYGHSVAGDTCDDGKPIFVPGSHIFTTDQYDHCPICGAPLINGHSQSGG
jgi:hypothetical protein